MIIDAKNGIFRLMIIFLYYKKYLYLYNIQKLTEHFPLKVRLNIKTYTPKNFKCFLYFNQRLIEAIRGI